MYVPVMGNGYGGLRTGARERFPLMEKLYSVVPCRPIVSSIVFKRREPLFRACRAKVLENQGAVRVGREGPS